MPSMKDLEQIADQALLLLRKEPEERQLALMIRARNLLEEQGLLGWISRYAMENDSQFVHEAIGENLLLPDWMMAKTISVENVLNAEDFEDLFLRLT